MYAYIYHKHHQTKTEKLKTLTYEYDQYYDIDIVKQILDNCKPCDTSFILPPQISNTIYYPNRHAVTFTPSVPPHNSAMHNDYTSSDLDSNATQSDNKNLTPLNTNVSKSQCIDTTTSCSNTLE